MITFANLAFGIALLVIGFTLVIKAVRGAAIIVRLLRRPTSAVARLRNGPAEISGKITAVGEPLVSRSGQRCVALKTTTGETTEQRVVPARLTDATGACRLDLDLSELVGERWQSHRVEKDDVVIEEELIPEGATVLVSGDATQGADPAGEWILAGTADDLLVVAIGGQTRLLTKSVVLGSLVFGIGAYLAIVGTTMMVVTLFS